MWADESDRGLVDGLVRGLVCGLVRWLVDGLVDGWVRMLVHGSAAGSVVARVRMLVQALEHLLGYLRVWPLASVLDSAMGMPSARMLALLWAIQSAYLLQWADRSEVQSVC